MEYDAWKLSGEPMDYCGDKANTRRKIAGYPDLTRRRVGKKFDVLYGLPQFVERDDAAIKKRATVNSEFDTLPGAIKKTHAQSIFQIGNRFCDDGVGHAELFNGLQHIPGLHDRQKNMQVTQPKPLANSIAPFHGPMFSRLANLMQQNRAFR